MSLLTLFQEDLLNFLAQYEKEEGVTEQRASDVEAFRHLINSADYAYDLWFAVFEQLNDVEGSPIAKVFPCFETSRLILGVKDILERPEYQPPFLQRARDKRAEVDERASKGHEKTLVIESSETSTASLSLSSLMEKVNYLNEALHSNSETLKENTATINVLKESRKRLQRRVSSLAQENKQLKAKLESQRLQELDNTKPMEKMAAKLAKKEKEVYALQKLIEDKQSQDLQTTVPFSRSLPATTLETQRLFSSPKT